MIINDKIKESLGNWWPWMQELVESETWDNLYKFLKAESQAGKVIIPKSVDTWKSLQLVDRHKVRAIIFLQCPYATQRDKVTIADGIPINCKNITPYQQPSLYMWHLALSQQYGFNPDVEEKCDISYLLEEEHVLLLNTSLTVELNKVDSHQSQWHDTMKWFIENVVNKYMSGIPICLIGAQAQKFEKYLNPLSNPIKKVEHMAAAAYQNRDWKHDNMHLFINSVIRANNGESEMIQWTRAKGEGKKVKETYPDWVVTTNPELLPDDLPF